MFQAFLFFGFQDILFRFVALLAQVALGELVRTWRKSLTSRNGFDLSGDLKGQKHTVKPGIDGREGYSTAEVMSKITPPPHLLCVCVGGGGVGGQGVVCMYV
jgi:hypothetical protein